MHVDYQAAGEAIAHRSAALSHAVKGGRDVVTMQGTPLTLSGIMYDTPTLSSTWCDRPGRNLHQDGHELWHTMLQIFIISPSDEWNGYRKTPILIAIPYQRVVPQFWCCLCRPVATCAQTAAGCCRLLTCCTNTAALQASSNGRSYALHYLLAATLWQRALRSTAIPVLLWLWHMLCATS